MNTEVNNFIKKEYTSPELKEWGSISEITLGYGMKAPDTEPYATYSSVGS